MYKVKLFTHNCIDGIGCAVALKSTYGTANVDVEMLNYDNCEDKIIKFFTKSHPTKTYNKVYITDLRVIVDLLHTKVIDGFDNLIENGDVVIIDHHVDYEMYHGGEIDNDKVPHLIAQIHNDEGNRESSTSLLVSYLMNNVASDIIREDIQSSLYEFANIIRIYDTNEIGRFPSHRKTEIGTIADVLDTLIDVYGADMFIDIMVGRIVRNDKIFNHMDVAMCNAMKSHKEKYAEKLSKDAVNLDDSYMIVFSSTCKYEIVNAMRKMYPDKILVCIDINGRIVTFACAPGSDHDMWKFTDNFGTRSGDKYKVECNFKSIDDPTELVRFIRDYMIDEQFREYLKRAKENHVF